MYDIDNIKRYLKGNLSGFRYEHSIMVAECAFSLARHYNLDCDKAYITGLLHDISKEFSEEENNKYIEKYNIDSKYTSIDCKKIIHSYVGAYYAKELFNIDDEMMHAIMYHTIGNINMDDFAKIILIADKLGRKDIDNNLNDLAYTNLDSALKYIIVKQKNKLEIEGRVLHSDTKELLKYLDKE